MVEYKEEKKVEEFVRMIVIIRSPKRHIEKKKPVSFFLKLLKGIDAVEKRIFPKMSTAWKQTLLLFRTN